MLAAVEEQRTKLINLLGVVECMLAAVSSEDPPRELDGADGGDRKWDQAANLPLETQASAAEKFNVSERSVRAAHKVHEKGSKALNDALDAGEVSVSRAAAVTKLPKREQLSAAKAKPAPAPKEELPAQLADDWEPPEDEAAGMIEDGGCGTEALGDLEGVANMLTREYRQEHPPPRLRIVSSR